MKGIVLWFALISFSGAFAQGEFINRSTAIPAGGIGTTKSVKPSVLSPDSNFPSTSKSIIEKKPIQFTQKWDFVNPGQPLQDKMNKRESDFNPQFVNKNQSFGEFRTKSEYVRICYRDYSAIDGDVVSIYTSDMMLVPTAILDMECHYMKLNLLKGANTINFKALNEGSSYPNTGELQIYDDQGQIITSNRWGLETGYVGTITIYKD
jgi:hypothetical protein